MNLCAYILELAPTQHLQYAEAFTVFKELVRPKTLNMAHLCARGEHVC